MEQKKSFLFRALELLLLGCAAFVFLAVCSLSTTPLLSYEVGQDAAFFRLVGRGMTAGLLPYRDFFDMKGPYLFLMEYLGQLLFPGRLGVFVLQWVCLFVSLLFAKKCLDLAFPERGCPIFLAAALLLPGAVMLSYTMTGGGLTEELSMPFLMPCLYLSLKYLNKTRLPSPENQDHPYLYGFLYGVAFGILALIRVTNAALLGAILLTVSCNLLVWKRFRNFFGNALCFLLGVAAGVLPGLVWSFCRGILGEMLTQVFLFGFQYSGEQGLSQKLQGVIQLWPCLFTGVFPLIVLAVYRVKDWKSWVLTLSSQAALLVAAMMGNGYAHYYVLALPLCVYGGFLLARENGRRFRRRASDRFVCLALSLALLLGSIGAQWPLLYPRGIREIRYAMYCAKYNSEDTEESDNLRALAGLVPEDASLYIYGFPSCSRLYVLLDRLPPMRYCDWQPHYIALVPEIGGEIESYLQTEEAYVLTPEDTVEPGEIRSALEARYEILETRGGMTLWERKAE